MRISFRLKFDNEATLSRESWLGIVIMEKMLKKCVKSEDLVSKLVVAAIARQLLVKILAFLYIHTYINTNNTYKAQRFTMYKILRKNKIRKKIS